MITEAELRQSIVAVWGEGSSQVAMFDKMLEKYVRGIAINSALQLKVDSLADKMENESSLLRSKIKMDAINVVDKIYSADKDPYSIHKKYITAIKKGIKNIR